MNPIFSLPEASTHAERVDHIFYGLLMLSGSTMLVVFALIVIAGDPLPARIECETGTTARNRQPRIRNRLDLGHAVPVRLFVLVGRLGRPQQPRGAGRRARNSCGRQTMDVEDPAAERRAGDQRAAHSASISRFGW